MARSKERERERERERASHTNHTAVLSKYGEREKEEGGSWKGPGESDPPVRRQARIAVVKYAGEW